MSDARQIDITQPSAMPTPAGGSAVGVPKRDWVIAVVKNNTELLCQEKLVKNGYDVYVPTQDVVVIDSRGRKRITTKVLIPAKVLLRITESERREIVELPYIIRFMTDRAKRLDKFGHHPIATIPDEQMTRMKFLLGHADVLTEFEPVTFNLGDRVRVARGGLMGAEGHIVECGDDTYFAIQVDFLGVAKVRISKEDLEQM